MFETETEEAIEQALLTQKENSLTRLTYFLAISDMEDVVSLSVLPHVFRWDNPTKLTISAICQIWRENKLFIIYTARRK